MLCCQFIGLSVKLCHIRQINTIVIYIIIFNYILVIFQISLQTTFLYYDHQYVIADRPRRRPS